MGLWFVCKRCKDTSTHRTTHSARGRENIFPNRRVAIVAERFSGCQW
jgi:hypothetical protein